MRTLPARMLTIRVALLCPALLLVTFSTAGALRLRQSGVPPLERTDKRWEEKSFLYALKGYEAALKAGAVPAGRKDEIAYRIVVALGKTSQWDRALAEALSFIKAHHNTVWEPRGLYWLGRLYVGMEHQGYRVGEKVVRGKTVPRSASDVKPMPVDLTYEDLLKARHALEAAHVLFPPYRLGYQTWAEEIDLNFDLVDILQQAGELAEWANTQKWPPPTDPAWTIATDTPYSADWPPPRKVLTLYAQIQDLTASRPESNHKKALALFDEAFWLRLYQRLMKEAGRKREGDQSIPVPYPYQDLSPVAPLRRILRETPEDEICAQAQLTIGQFEEEETHFVEALADYKQVFTLFPASTWAADARYRSHFIPYAGLSMEAPAPQLPGKPVSVRLSYRNLAHVHFTAYRVHLEDVIGSSTFRNRYGSSAYTFQGLYGDIDAAEKKWGAPVAQWEVTTIDRGDYLAHAQVINTPLKDAGCYALIASADKIKSANIVMISDLAFVQSMDYPRGFMYVASAETGAPMPSAHIVSKQSYYNNNDHVSETKRATTDAHGQAEILYTRAPEQRYPDILSLAYFGNHCAFAMDARTPVGDSRDQIEWYLTTDKAVYTPGQRVRFHQIVMRRRNGKLEPVVNESIHVRVTGPRGEQILATTARPNAFGGVQGEFVLPMDAARGGYSIGLTVPALPLPYVQAADRVFRVEEPAKPEFDVTVTTGRKVKLGQSGSATVSAHDNSGSPISGAAVSYRVYCTAQPKISPPPYRFSPPNAFLYRYADYFSSSPTARSYFWDDLVTQGTETTDAAGNARILFPTGTGKIRGSSSDLHYTVEAVVTDASRHAAVGIGSLKAARHNVTPYLDFVPGYATQGRQVEVEVMTLDPLNHPISVHGLARIYLQPTAPDATETRVYSKRMATNKLGRAQIKWIPDKPGCYRIAYQTKDSGGTVSADTKVWVARPDLASNRLPSSGMFLATDHPYYEEGQTAKALLVTPEPGSTVLLTRATNGLILDREVIPMAGTSKELPIPLGQGDDPNVFLSAILIRNGQIQQTVRELIVPPLRQVLNMQIYTDKEHYQPGEHAHLRLSAHDWKGNPVHAELSVGVGNVSSDDIQNKDAPDIRSFFYGNHIPPFTDGISFMGPAVNTVGASVSPTGTSCIEYIKDTQPRDEGSPHEWSLPAGMGQLADWPGNPKRYIYYNIGNWGFEPDFGGVFNRDIYNRFRGDFYGNRPGGDFNSGGSGGLAGGKFGLYGLSAMATGESPGELGRSNESAARHSSWTYVPPSAAELAHQSRIDSLRARTHPADTAFWAPEVVTDANGEASVDFTWPVDIHAEWRIQAIGITANAQIGTAETRVSTQ